MSHILVIGNFGDLFTSVSDGQTIKTRNLTTALKSKYGDVNVNIVNTYKWKSHPFSLLFRTITSCRKSDKVIMMPAQNGVRIFSYLLYKFRKKNTKLYYSVIGGWLPLLIEKHIKIRTILIKFDGIWVETSTMKRLLDMQGFNNTSVIPNFKNIKPLQESDIYQTKSEPLLLCTFSRVMKQKGIEDAIFAVDEINKTLGRVVYKLDIFGNIAEEYLDEFSLLEKKFPSYIRYCGCINSEESVSVIKNYFLLLFPTRFFTEGIPGTIIDSYSAAVPVIASMWESFEDVIDDLKTGFGYNFADREDLKNKLLMASYNILEINAMKVNCLKKANDFSSSSAFDKINW